MPGSSADVPRLVEHLFRRHAAVMVARLVRVLGPGNLGLAEEVVQDALLKALDIWPMRGIPDDPTAWLTRVARNRAVDLVRHEASLRARANALAASLPDAPGGEEQLGDDVLAMSFLCCHPVISSDSRVALTLKAVCGLGVGEISRAFLADETAVAQRLARAKRRIRERAIAFELPSPSELPARLESVLEVIYLLFNEGYTAYAGKNLIRAELCEEAAWLGRLVTEHPETDLPQSHALLSLMLLKTARQPARVDRRGELVLLPDQDRTLWDRRLIDAGLRHLERASEGSLVSRYQLEAAIAAHHVIPQTYEDTDWPEIVRLYDDLLSLDRSPVVALNRAIALSRGLGPRAGIEALREVEQDSTLRRYHLLPATLGRLWEEAGDLRQAADHYRAALDLPCSDPERRLLTRWLTEVIGQPERSR
ncbi:MAG: RNA polymerase sigma factor [Candidatus Rokuibacteriota bacterium]